MVHQELGDCDPDTLDTQSGEETRWGLFFAGLDRRQQVGGFFLTKPFQGQDLVGRQVVDVGYIVEEAEFDK